MHKRLTAAIQSGANAGLYEAQLVRRLECGTCHQQYGARVRWTEHGTLICPECATILELTAAICDHNQRVSELHADIKSIERSAGYLHRVEKHKRESQGQKVNV